MGEAEVIGAKLSGVTVHIAARTMVAAGPGEVIVTGVVKDLVPGSGFQFEDRGVHQLKGVPGEWRLLALAGVDGQSRPPHWPQNSSGNTWRRSSLPPSLVGPVAP